MDKYLLVGKVDKVRARCAVGEVFVSVYGEDYTADDWAGYARRLIVSVPRGTYGGVLFVRDPEEPTIAWVDIALRAGGRLPGPRLCRYVLGSLLPMQGVTHCAAYTWRAPKLRRYLELLGFKNLDTETGLYATCLPAMTLH